MYQKQYHIFFTGIGGIGMSGIAELLLNLGYHVSGSDINSSDITARLQQLGATVFIGHAAEHIRQVDVVVISSAIKDNNPEVQAARLAGIPVIPRAEMLAELMRLKYSIAVAGAHGKTSTTSIVASILGYGGLDPTVVIGGKLKSLGTNAVLGKGEFIVAEADESDGSFLKFSPTIAIVTNIDLEHLDFYNDIYDIKQTFLKFIERIPFYGLAVLCLDNSHVKALLPHIQRRFITYGIHSEADLQARNVCCKGLQSSFRLFYRRKDLGAIHLGLPGIHSVYNTLAGIAVALELGLPLDIIRESLQTLEGVQRRMEIKGNIHGITVMDDYGHHPTEIRTTLKAVHTCWPEKRVIVVFQPHRYSRTEALFDEFICAFDQTDQVLVLPIYAASEAPIEGINSRNVCKAIEQKSRKKTLYMENQHAAVVYLLQTLQPGDL
jgi:UDP-N-acetylmuramate--alanine ligase